MQLEPLKHSRGGLAIKCRLATLERLSCAPASRAPSPLRRLRRKCALHIPSGAARHELRPHRVALAPDDESSSCLPSPSPLCSHSPNRSENDSSETPRHAIRDERRRELHRLLCLLFLQLLLLLRFDYNYEYSQPNACVMLIDCAFAPHATRRLYCMLILDYSYT